jgi:hypothetical protein
MPGWKTAISYGIGIVFDSLRFLFAILVVSGPYFAGVAAQIWADSHSFPSWASWAVGWVVTVVVAGAEIAFPPIAALMVSIGAIAATILGFAGGVALTGWFLLGCRINPFGGKKMMKTMLGWTAGFIPFFNFLPIPTLTITAWFIVSDARKEDREAQEKWKKENAAKQKQAQQARNNKISQIRQLQMIRAQQEAAMLYQAQNEQIAKIKEDEEAEAQAEEMKNMTANDTKEIPDDYR